MKYQGLIKFTGGTPEIITGVLQVLFWELVKDNGKGAGQGEV